MRKEPYYSVVFSDLHFGDSRCSLHSMKTAYALVEHLRAFAPLREVILLGDILDLQLANWAQALEGRILPGPKKRAVGFRYFLNFLLKETGARNVIYVPGNHDYRIFDYHSVEKYLLAPLRQGRKLSGKISFFRTFSEGFLQGILQIPDAKIQVVYPHHLIRLNGSRLVLTHGHFFDPSQAFNHEVGRVFSRKGPLTAEEIRKIRHSYFRRVSLYQNVVSGFSMKKDLREWFSALYQPLTAWKWNHKIRKTFLTPAMRRSISHYVQYCCRTSKIDGVIFGHTHRPGATVLHDGPVKHVWNCGTFLRESKNSPLGSFLTIRHDGDSNLPDAVLVHHLAARV